MYYGNQQGALVRTVLAVMTMGPGRARCNVEVTGSTRPVYPALTTIVAVAATMIVTVLLTEARYSRASKENKRD